MSLFDDFFYRPWFNAPDIFGTPRHQLLVVPTRPQQQGLRRTNSELERNYDEFVRGVDERFSGMLGEMEGPGNRDVEVQREGGAEGEKNFHMKLNVQDFEPEDIHVKVQGNQVTVHAKKEQKNEQEGMYAHSYKEIKRTVTLPKGVDPKGLTSVRTGDGILEIEAPIVAAIEPAPEVKQPVKITHE